MTQFVIACDWPYEIRVGVTFPLNYKFAEALNERLMRAIRLVDG